MGTHRRAHTHTYTSETFVIMKHSLSLHFYQTPPRSSTYNTKQVFLTDKLMLSLNSNGASEDVVLHDKKKIPLAKSVGSTVYCKYVYGYANAVAVHCVYQ